MGALHDIGQKAILDHLTKLAAEGLTAKEASVALGESYNQLMIYARKFGVVFRRPTTADNTFRNMRIAECERRYRAGETLSHIGAHFGISRERVRQLLTRAAGVDSSDGGARVRAEVKKKERQSQRDRDALSRWGCTRDSYESLLRIGKEMVAAGAKRERTPTGAFISQKRNAHNRGISWELTLWQWWTVWEQSGCWDQRGRGHGYVMCRNGDAGPYSPDNVMIAPGHANSSFQARKKSELPIGVRQAGRGRFAACIHVNGKRVHLGIYPTAAQAHDAYLTAIADAIGHNKPEAA